MAQIKLDGKTSKKQDRIISFLTKRIIAFCVISGIIVSVTVIDAFNFNFFDGLEYFTKKIYSAISGKEVQKDDINRIASDSKKYATIEELEKNENIDIIVPMWLPDDIEIKFINYANDFLEEQIYLIYNDDKTALTIKLNSIISTADGAEIYEDNDIIFYIFKEANVIWWEYDGNFYNLSSKFDISEYAEKIIENIK